ncbi:MAG: gluconate 2-dehydrogenase subunit 3 family protein [Candidatus Dadabacteria bacterium]|nr:MAG: gluconate 2-dehydrogenase subunit 3 family protein [Candidatus Dadabacteria bacterium]
MKRRSFIIKSAVSALSAAGLYSCVSVKRALSRKKGLLTQQNLLTLRALHQHLLPPGESSPGALELGTDFYLSHEISRIPWREKNLLISGLLKLNARALKDFKRPFKDLKSEEKESLLKACQKNPENDLWLELVITYLLEGALAAPAYGGNRNTKAWKWLNHNPGFPLPFPGKRYYEL